MKNEKYNKINNNPYPLLILLSGRERSFSGLTIVFFVSIQILWEKSLQHTNEMIFTQK